MSNENRTTIRTNIDLRKFIWYKIINMNEIIRKGWSNMDKHKIATKIIAIFMIVAMLIATASTLLYFIFAK